MTPNNGSWLNSPMNRLEMHKAFHAQATTVVLVDPRGCVLTIDYTIRKGFAWLQPQQGGLVPCGWFAVAKVLDPAWIAHSA